MVGLVFRFVAIGVVVFIVWRLFQPRYSLKIVIGSQGIKHHHGLSKSQQTDVLDFLEKHRSFDGDVTILGRYDSNRFLQLVVKGKLEREAEQRIRNFLTNELTP